MLLLLPVKTDLPTRRTPWVNYTLVILNIVMYVVTAKQGQYWLKERLMLWAEHPRYYQFFSSMFLHAGLLHLGGNMVFLWVFGNSLNNKLGNATYLMFYLAGGLFAAASYAVFSTGAMLGASGAVFGVTAGYLVLFPSSRVTTLYWFLFFIGLIELSGLTIIGYFIVVNVVYLLMQAETGVAHLAHLGGAAFGLLAATVLLATGAVGRDQFDLLALISRWRRRAAYRSIDWSRRPTVEASEVGSRPLSDPVAAHVVELRHLLAQAMAAGDAEAAGQSYALLRSVDPRQVLPRQQQLDLGNLLASRNQHALAADAYESLLANYPSAQHAEQVELLLGLIYRRYLDNPVRGKLYLERALPRLADPNQQSMARDEIALANRAMQQ